jgi:Asp-tRNA(Asn)/Glu-tRNA(Gln) amidotransferase C subunit
LVRLIDTAEPLASPTTTPDMLRKDVPDTLTVVKLILTNVPGVETLQPGVVMAPATPIMVPAVLSIFP